MCSSVLLNLTDSQLSGETDVPNGSNQWRVFLEGSRAAPSPSHLVKSLQAHQNTKYIYILRLNFYFYHSVCIEITAEELIEILSKLQYGQVQYPHCKSCNFLIRGICVNVNVKHHFK